MDTSIEINTTVLSYVTFSTCISLMLQSQKSHRYNQLVSSETLCSSSYIIAIYIYIYNYNQQANKGHIIFPILPYGSISWSLPKNTNNVIIHGFQQDNDENTHAKIRDFCNKICKDHIDL